MIIESGINWTWCYFKSEDEARDEYFKMFGRKMPDGFANKPIVRKNGLETDKFWSFRIHY